ncbi:hypothetical protein B0H15DRAFT_807898 [Mycena belliarum]|uniref:Uncharacterized protein n=1 Tax=Mycena belliarum TaxID=1033014 RepID=A0AAD6TNB1_9AGAR|nr:hypothetical protein B0H15DRAFT_807898 [Mycena belliae]
MLHEERPIYTFVPYRATPQINIIQNDGSSLTAAFAGPANAPRAVGARMHAPATIGINGHRRKIAKIAARLQARLDARPDPDAQLLARLNGRDAVHSSQAMLHSTRSIWTSVASTITEPYGALYASGCAPIMAWECGNGPPSAGQACPEPKSDPISFYPINLHTLMGDLSQHFRQIWVEMSLDNFPTKMKVFKHTNLTTDLILIRIPAESFAECSYTCPLQGYQLKNSQ